MINSAKDWQTVGSDVSLLVNMQFAGEFLGESFALAVFLSSWANCARQAGCTRAK